MRKLVTATVSAALCMMSVLPGVAAAQEYHFSGFDAPRGVTATVNLRVPLGRERAQRANYGLTLGYGQTVPPGLDGRTSTRAINFADFRFSGNELRQARVASFDLANLDRSRRQMNLTGESNSLWIVVGLVAAGVAVCLLADCFGGDDDDSSSN
ncbi:MAG TPA: hypothetical protein VEB65_00310 [Solirubrobacterales bacterium]|nr:hypothetical protein [Solirubrobacterales bacterium]